jgi:hypothetical protein
MSAVQVVSGAVEDVFDRAVSRMPSFLLSVPPIPGVAKVEMHAEAEPGNGARRSVFLTDGSVTEEEIVAFARPALHAYRWLDPPPMPFALVVRTGRAEWTFTEQSGATRVEWTYWLELTTPLVYPLGMVIRALFRRWMVRGLERLSLLS